MHLPHTIVSRSSHSVWKWISYIAMYVCILTCAPVYALDSTFLVQLGTFSSEADAVKKWDDVKAKNADVVGSLTLHVAEVVIPPDNVIHYRTQAGPISTHAQAESLCSSLQSRSIECNVVETALFTEEVPTSSQPASAPVSTAVAASEAMKNQPPAPSSSGGWFSSLFSSKPSNNQTPPAQPSAPPAPPAAPIAPVAETPVAPAVTEVVTPMPITTTASPAPSVSAPSTPTVAAATAVSLPAQTTQAETPSPTTKPSSGWLDSVFSSKPADNQIPPAAAPKTVTVAPTPSVTTQAVAAPASASAFPPVTPSDQVVPGRGEKFLDAEPLPASATSVAVASPPAITEAPVPPANVSSSNVGKVDVAEAIHVPLSDTNKKHSFNVSKQLPAVSGQGGTPSSVSAKLFWAQISYFPSEEEARSFYASLVAAYPQFSEGLRARVTHPYAVRHNARVSLRVGPFASVREVHTVCDAAHTSSDTAVHCSLVRDLSNSAAAEASRNRVNLGTLYDDRAPSNAATNDMQPAADTPSGTQKFWVQLGSFASPDMAWDSWNNLKENHKKLLKSVQASVVTPVNSSASRALFRLRAGPFLNEAGANILCDKLSAIGEGCIVLNDN